MTLHQVVSPLGIIAGAVPDVWPVQHGGCRQHPCSGHPGRHPLLPAGGSVWHADWCPLRPPHWPHLTLHGSCPSCSTTAGDTDGLPVLPHCWDLPPVWHTRVSIIATATVHAQSWFYSDPFLGLQENEILSHCWQLKGTSQCLAKLWDISKVAVYNMAKDLAWKISFKVLGKQRGLL